VFDTVFAVIGLAFKLTIYLIGLGLNLVIHYFETRENDWAGKEEQP
jgi:hypothetical protein